MSFGEKLKLVGIKSTTFIVECKRVFHATKKSGKQEFLVIVKVAGFGMIAIGAIGFVLQTGKQILFKG